jgi:hypothetical protein
MPHADETGTWRRNLFEATAKLIGNFLKNGKLQDQSLGLRRKVDDYERARLQPAAELVA